MAIVLLAILFMLLGLPFLWMSIFGKNKKGISRILFFILGIGVEIIALYLVNFYLYFQI